MSVSTLDELFEHGLEDIYFAEHELLGELAEQTDDEEIARAFRDHREETRGHIDRVEEVFEMSASRRSERSARASRG